MHKKKNQKSTTNHVVQKQADTSPTKKLKPTQAQHTPLKEEDNYIMKIIAYTDNPTGLKNAIDEKIIDNELKTWEIVKNIKKEVLYNHNREQWNEKAMPKPYIYNNRIEFIIKWWNKNEEPDEAIKGYIIGRFIEILMVHFREKFIYLKII